MISKRTAMIIAAAATLLAATGTAQAQRMGRGMGTGSGPVASACAMEINRYCSNMRHGGGAVRSCLAARRTKLSRNCRWALNNTGYGRRWR